MRFPGQSHSAYHTLTKHFMFYDPTEDEDLEVTDKSGDEDEEDGENW